MHDTPVNAQANLTRRLPTLYSCQALFPLWLSHSLHSLVLLAPIDAFWVPPYIGIGMHTTSLHDAPGHVKGRRHHSILRQMLPEAAAARFSLLSVDHVRSLGFSL